MDNWIIMRKKIIYISIASLILALSFFVVFYRSDHTYFSGNLNAKGVGNIYNSFKKNCSVVSAVSGKYQNSIFGLEFDYPENFAICEKYTFDKKDDGLEIYIWDKTDFGSSEPLNGPIAVIYINKSLLTNDYLMNFYSLSGFNDSDFSMSSNKILRKEIQENTCTKESCKFNIYKVGYEGNSMLIMEYKNINSIISSLSNFIP